MDMAATASPSASWPRACWPPISPASSNPGSRLSRSIAIRPDSKRSSALARRVGVFVEEQRLADQRLDHVRVERLGDEEGRLRLGAGQEPFREGGDEDHR